MRMTGEIWFILVLFVFDLVGMGWYIASLPVAIRQKMGICIGLACGAAVTALASLAKGYSPAKGAVLYGNVVAGALMLFLVTRRQMIQGFKAEADGVNADLEKRPIYIGVGWFFIVFIGLSIVEYLAFHK